MGLRDRLRNALVVLLEETPPQPTTPSVAQPALSEADIRRLVAEYARGVASTVESTVDETVDEMAQFDSESNSESTVESNITDTVESNSTVTVESNSATTVESNIILPSTEKRRRGMIARIERLHERAKWPPAGRRYFELVDSYNDDGDPIQARKDLGFVEESIASLCDVKGHPLFKKQWTKERPAWFPENYGVVDDKVVEIQYVQKPHHLPTDPGWLSVLRQDVPPEMLDRHDYYASFGMRGWLAPDGNRFALIYWSPDPANWADDNDKPVAPWPQEEAIAVGPVSLTDFDAIVSEDEGQPCIRLCAHRVTYVDEPFAGARATWGRQAAPRTNRPSAPKRTEFVFNFDSEKLTLDEARRSS